MSQEGTRKKTEKKDISGFNYGELRTTEAKGRENTLKNASAFSTNRTYGRGAEENATSLEFSTRKGTEDKLGKVSRQAFLF